ncbi:MAG: UDP-N-acetylmuramoyl-tripeptide--D-alanyl-D-alanine ligase [Thermoanaerobaculia bacterium]|nr:UDP-N-acetylmuramoyl-tripeptide--D-alanyl-D-alanine ligase [Thermoanaerobaculia bacterium]
MAELTFTEIARLAGGEVIAGGEIVVERVVIDSREADSSSVFFAIRGERKDGHDFLDQALEQAKGGVVERLPAELPRGKGFVQVADTTRALQDLARGLRSERDWTVIGVTGSAGKTTTKEMIASLLESERKVWKTWGNFNNHIGLPLCISNTPDEADLIVAEMGMSAPGEIDFLAKLARPGLGVYTTIQPVHLEFFESIEGIAAAKRELLENIDASGAIVINADDHRVVGISEGFEGRKTSYGIEHPADVMATDIESLGLYGTRFILRAEGESFEASLRLPGRHNLENLLAAVGAARLMEITWDGILEGIDSIAPATHRGELVEIRGATFYDDTYNSNPYALSRALELLTSAECEGRRIAVIGDMLELGRSERKLHYDAGNLAPADIDLILAVGELSRAVIEGAAAAGFPRENLFHVSDASKAADFLDDLVGPGDLVLLKGSRGIGLDRVIDRLRGEG